MQSSHSPEHTRSWSVEIPHSPPPSDLRSNGYEHRRSLSGGSAPLGLQSPYTLTLEQSVKFDAVFETHSEGGVMSGARVRDCLIKSELPKEELSTVWGLCKSEANLSPNLGKFEFRVAMHLVTLRLQGVPLPHILPACLQPQRDGDLSVVRPTAHSVDWGAAMAISPQPGSPARRGIPRHPSVDWAAGLPLSDPLSRSFPGMPLSRQPSQGSGRQSFRAANPFRRQESGSLREDPEGDGQRKSARDLLSGMGLGDRKCAEALLSTASAEPQPPGATGATRPQEASDRESFWATTAAQKAAFAAAFGRAQDSGAAEPSAAEASGSTSSSGASEAVTEAGYVSRTEALQLFERVWRLSDLDRDGRLSASEFSRALVCVSRLLEGRPLPQVPAASLRREGPLQVNGSARCHCVLERCELKLYTCDLLSETLASALQKPPQVALPLDLTATPTPTATLPLATSRGSGWSYLHPPPLPLALAPTPTLTPVQVTIPLGGAISFSRLDTSQTSRPHVFLLTSTEPLRLSLDSFTRSTTEVDFQATDEHGLQSWLDDLQYVCADPLAAPPPPTR